MLINDIGASAQLPHQPVQRILVGVGRHPVEHRHITGLYFFRNQLTHIGIVIQDGVGVRKKHQLIDDPLCRHRQEKIVQIPHSVVFHDHPFRPGALGFGLQALFGHFRRIVVGDHRHIFHVRLVFLVFFYPLFTYDEKRLLACIEFRVRKSFLDKFGFAGFQKPREQIHGKLLLVLLFCHSSSFPSKGYAPFCNLL